MGDAQKLAPCRCKRNHVYCGLGIDLLEWQEPRLCRVQHVDDALEVERLAVVVIRDTQDCLLYTSPSPRDGLLSRMPSSA